MNKFKIDAEKLRLLATVIESTPELGGLEFLNRGSYALTASDVMRAVSNRIDVAEEIKLVIYTSMVNDKWFVYCISNGFRREVGGPYNSEEEANLRIKNGPR